VLSFRFLPKLHARVRGIFVYGHEGKMLFRSVSIVKLFFIRPTVIEIFSCGNSLRSNTDCSDHHASRLQYTPLTLSRNRRILHGIYASLRPQLFIKTNFRRICVRQLSLGRANSANGFRHGVWRRHHIYNHNWRLCSAALRRRPNDKL
jgi:hypothetical protein